MPTTPHQTNGGAKASQSVTSRFAYILVNTGATSILPNGLTSGGQTGTPTSQNALDRVIEIVSMRGQPVIIGAPTFAASVYTVRLAVEHIDSWTDAAGTAAPLTAAFAAHGGAIVTNIDPITNAVTTVDFGLSAATATISSSL